LASDDNPFLTSAGHVTVPAPRDRLARLRPGFGTGLYAILVGGLAAVGDTRSAGPLLGAAVLTLPCGLGALIGVYVVYAVLIGASNLVGATVMTGNGWSPTWFVVVDEIAVTLLFVVAATVNSVAVRGLVDAIRRRRSRHRPPPGR
jgi:hypothetical protein